MSLEPKTTVGDTVYGVINILELLDCLAEGINMTVSKSSLPRMDKALST